MNLESLWVTLSIETNVIHPASNLAELGPKRRNTEAHAVYGGFRQC